MALTAAERAAASAAWGQALGGLAAGITLAAGGSSQQAAGFGTAANALGTIGAQAALPQPKPPVSLPSGAPSAGPADPAEIPSKETGWFRWWYAALAVPAGIAAWLTVRLLRRRP